MPLVEWEPKYSVGIAAIDAQHKNLVDMINQLHEAMRLGKANQELNPVLDRLVEYTNTHFKAEELLLQTNGYPTLADHKKIHSSMVGQITDLKAKLQKSSVGMSVTVSNFLKTWLTDHIMVEDKKYGAYLTQKGVK
jgi:hemerythrin